MADCRAPPLGYDQVADLIEIFEFVDRTHEVVSLVAAQGAPGEVEIGDPDDCLNGFERNPPGGQSFLVHLDLDFLFEAARHLGCGDPGTGFKSLLDPSFGQVAQGAEVARP